MIKRISSFIASLLLSFSSLFVFAPVMVRAAADTCTWTGAGVDANFSTAANWSCSTDILETGDALVFDATAVDFDTKQPVNDMTGATFTSITYTADTTNYDYPTISGDSFSLSGNIVSDGFGLVIENDVTLTGNSNMGTVSIEGDLNIGAHTLTSSGYTYLKGEVSGSGDFIAADGGEIMFYAANTFTGDVTVQEDSRVSACAIGSLGTTAGGTTVQDGGYLALAVADKGTSSEPLTLAGEGLNGYALDVYSGGCGGGGGKGGEITKLQEPSAYEATLDDVTLSADTTVYVNYKETLNIEGATLGGHSLTISDNDYSKGTLVVNGSSSTHKPRKVTVKTDTTDYYTMFPGEELTVNGKISSVSLYKNSTLKGSGQVEYGIYAYPDSTVALGNSPGCMKVGDINFSENNFVVEIAGAKACSGYDQLQVTQASGEADDNKNVYLFDPVLELSFPSDDYLPAAGTKFVIIDNDGDDAVQGTFADLPEGETFESNGGVFGISYEGGDGNDVELTVVTAPSAPDTGFENLKVNPLVVLLASGTLAGALFMIDRKYQRLLKK